MINSKIKRGIIRFYLRAQRIRTPKFLNDEFDYAENFFRHFPRPKSFIQRAKIKALKTRKCKCSPEISNNNFKNKIHYIDISFYSTIQPETYRKKK